MTTLTDHPTLPLADFDGMTMAEPPEDDAPEPSPCGLVHTDGICPGFECQRTQRVVNPLTGRVEYRYGHWVHEGDLGYEFEDGTTGEACTECSFCSEHCECQTCGSCTYRVRSSDDMCRACDECNDCCSCFVCAACETRQTQSSIARGRNSGACDRCEYCDECCECNDNVESGIEERDATVDPHFHTPTIGQLQRNPSKRYAALEIEISDAESGTLVEHRDRNGWLMADAAINVAAEKWDCVITTDGSISDGSCDFEINTAPAAGDLLLDQLSDFGEAFLNQSAKANSTCGLHVHVDCRDFTFYDMRRMVLLYEKIEGALFKMVPAGRPDSGYCDPCGPEYARAVRASRMPKDNKKNLIARIYKCEKDDDTIMGTIQRAKANKYGANGHRTRERYRALNLHSWVYRGTVECRLHHGITDTEGLTNWALLWVGIVDNAYKMSEAAIGKLDGTGLEILQSLAPNDTVREWIASETEKFQARYR